MQLHSVLYSHCEGNNFDGKFKNVQNYINSFDESGKSYTIFTPLSPFKTPIAIEIVIFYAFIHLMMVTVECVGTNDFTFI